MTLKSLLIIRFSLILGVVLVTGVSFWMRRDGGGITPPADTLAMMRYAVWALSGMAIVVAVILRKVRDGRPEALRPQLTLAGWMPGEAAALLAVVSHISGGAVETLTVGLLAFVGALLILPLPTIRR